VPVTAAALDRATRRGIPYAAPAMWATSPWT